MCKVKILYAIRKNGCVYVCCQCRTFSLVLWIRRKIFLYIINIVNLSPSVWSRQYDVVCGVLVF